MSSPTITIVAPVYNEESVVGALVERLVALDQRLPDERLEFLIVDDGSTDGTWDRLQGLAVQHELVRAIRFSRNFGHQMAITAGLDLARGEAVITLDGDLQHPPERVPDMVAAWRQGADIVYMIRDGSEKLGLAKRFTSHLFYWLMNLFSGIQIPSQAADFRLVGPKPLAALRGMRESRRFLRGMVPWLGYETEILHYTESDRTMGSTKYSWTRMLKLAVDGVLSSSVFPLRLAFLVGLLFALLDCIYIAYVLIAYLVSNQLTPGWTSLLVVVLTLGSVQLVTLGIVGEYIARIYDEIKGRPLYLLAEDTLREAVGEAKADCRDDRASGVDGAGTRE